MKNEKEDSTMLLSFFEFIAVVLLIVGFIYEDKVIAFEKRIAEKYKAHRNQREVNR